MTQVIFILIFPKLAIATIEYLNFYNVISLQLQFFCPSFTFELDVVEFRSQCESI